MKLNLIPKSKFLSTCCGLCLAIFIILLLQHTYVESFTQVTGDMQNTSNWITDANKYNNLMSKKNAIIIKVLLYLYLKVNYSFLNIINLNLSVVLVTIHLLLVVLVCQIVN